MICFGVEIIGLLLVGTAAMPVDGKIGVFTHGDGVFAGLLRRWAWWPSKAVPRHWERGAALATIPSLWICLWGLPGRWRGW